MAGGCERTESGKEHFWRTFLLCGGLIGSSLTASFFANIFVVLSAQKRENCKNVRGAVDWVKGSGYGTVFSHQVFVLLAAVGGGRFIFYLG